MKYSVYILKCCDEFYYVGVTNDLDARLYEHHSGINPKAYTFKRRPLELVFCEHFLNVEDAIAFEKQLKGWRRAKKEAFIAGRWDLLPELARSYSRKQL